MTEEEIKKKAKEIAEANGRTYRDQEYGDINTIALGEKGITPEQLGDYIITGCPYCHYSFCE